MRILAIQYFADKNIAPARELVPQLADLNKLYLLVALYDEDPLTLDGVADYFVLSAQEARHYLETAQYLGLFDTDDGQWYVLTDLGISLISTRIGEHSYVFAKLVINSWIFLELIRLAIAHGSFTDEHIDAIIRSVNDHRHRKRYGERSIKRSRKTIIVWIKWLAQEFGCFTISADGYRLQ